MRTAGRRRLDRRMNPAAALAGVAIVVCGVAADRARRTSEGGRVRRRLGTPRQMSRALHVPGAPAWLASSLVDAEIPLTAERAWLTWIAVVVATAAAGGVLGGPALALGGAALGAVGPLVVLRARRDTASA